MRTAAFCAALALGVLAFGSAPTWSVFTDASSSPGNALATGTSFWFDAHATGTAICAGTNRTLSCVFGTQAQNVTLTATFALTNKNGASNTFTVAVVDGSGPAGIGSLVTAKFSTNNSSTILAPGGTDTVNVQLKTKNNTTLGTYAGTILVTDTTTGRATSIPLSVTVQ